MILHILACDPRSDPTRPGADHSSRPLRAEYENSGSRRAPAATLEMIAASAGVDPAGSFPGPRAATRARGDPVAGRGRASRSSACVGPETSKRTIDENERSIDRCAAFRAEDENNCLAGILVAPRVRRRLTRDHEPVRHPRCDAAANAVNEKRRRRSSIQGVGAHPTSRTSTKARRVAPRVCPRRWTAASAGPREDPRARSGGPPLPRIGRSLRSRTPGLRSRGLPGGGTPR
jgi:hypothetical protein